MGQQHYTNTNISEKRSLQQATLIEMNYLMKLAFGKYGKRQDSIQRFLITHNQLTLLEVGYSRTPATKCCTI